MNKLRGSLFRSLALVPALAIVAACGGSPTSSGFGSGDSGTGTGPGSGASGGGDNSGTGPGGTGGDTDGGTTKLTAGDSGTGAGGTGDGGSGDCPPSAKLIYVTGSSNQLYSYNPETAAFTKID